MKAKDLRYNQAGKTIRHERRIYMLLDVDVKASHVRLRCRTARGVENLILPPDTEVELEP
ncbi:hypothetical protein [Prescottella equi]|uniref:hypothetical protein n=1 Tax=Rhodococcus hoagii TaxID=43767 RepID=UPI000D0F99BB|nr:hypothetical protein [Prescottella equi]AVP71268.1 hypothetical protein C7H75_24615 [Prescottella equi]